MEGKRVCIAAPRVDVILELEPRLRAAFPQTAIEALIWWCKTDDGNLRSSSSRQPISSTDSVTPSMPFSSTKLTLFLIRRKKHCEEPSEKQRNPNAPIHFVTATPSDKLIADIKRTGQISTINRRYHGHPLPVPRYDTLWNYTKHIRKGKLPKKLIELDRSNDSSNKSRSSSSSITSDSWKKRSLYSKNSTHASAPSMPHIPIGKNMSKRYATKKFPACSQRRFSNEASRSRMSKSLSSGRNSSSSTKAPSSKSAAVSGVPYNYPIRRFRPLPSRHHLRHGRSEKRNQSVE